MAKVEIVAGAEDFALGDPSAPTAALIIHGFTSSPQVVRPIGQFLADRGIRAVGPRLPGHGTSWQDLNACNEAMWIQTAQDAFEKLAVQHERVFVVGFSFGAALAIDLVARHQERVAGLIVLASFLHTKDPGRFLLPVVRYLIKSLPGVGNDTADPAGDREIVYDRVPTGAAHCMLRFTKRARRALPSLRVPILIVHGRNDHTAHPSNASLIYDSVTSDDKEIVWLERSYHVLPFDYDRAEMFERTYRFIAERASVRHA